MLYAERFHISFCLRFRSLDTNPRHDITEASFVLFIWLIGLLLESGCKGIAFLQTSKTFAEKSWVFSSILTDVYN